MPALLASAAYDPGTAATVVGTAATAMTAFDTTNLRLTFTCPAGGIVLVRARVSFAGTTGPPPWVLLGVLDGATVRLRSLGVGQQGTALALNVGNTEATALCGYVTGLTPGNSFTWDLAYGVEVTGAAGSVMRWGGPNDNVGADASGAITFEIWDPGPSLLAAISYDPSTAGNLATSLRAMTAMDTTNLRATFTAPASGQVLWRLQAAIGLASTAPLPGVLLGILESTTVVARQSARNSLQAGTTSTLPAWSVDASGVVTGVSAGSHSWDAAYAIQVAGGSVNYKIKYGGPNNTTTDDAWGAATFELWDASSGVSIVSLIQ